MRVGSFLAHLGCALMIVGGLGDQFVTSLLPAHAEIMGVPPERVPAGAAALLLALLHTLGYALIAVGTGALVLLRQMLATGRTELGVWIGAMTVLSEGANAFYMYRLEQPLYVVPTFIVALVILGLCLSGVPSCLLRGRS